MAWRDDDNQVAQRVAQIQQATADCKAILDDIAAKAAYWGNHASPVDGRVDGYLATDVKAWMSTVLQWLAAEQQGSAGNPKANLHQTLDELDHGGGGGAPQAQKPGKPKGKKPAKKPGKKKKKGNA